jgi:hypothetical protein
VLRPGQIRGEPWLSRALVKLNELDQYDDAELVRKKTAAMFAGFITRQNPEDNLMGEGSVPMPTAWRWPVWSPAPADSGARRGHQVLRPADVGGELRRVPAHAVPGGGRGHGHHLRATDRRPHRRELLVDPCRPAGVPASLRDAMQHGVLVHQMCRPIWAAWMKQAVLEGPSQLPGFARGGLPRRGSTWQ